MHEASIVSSILKIIVDKADELKIEKVTKIKLNIGELSGVNEEAINFAFDAGKKETIMEASTLEIKKIEGRASCEVCNTSFKLSRFHKFCPKCNSINIKIIQGYELEIEDFIGE